MVTRMISRAAFAALLLLPGAAWAQGQKPDDAQIEGFVDYALAALGEPPAATAASAPP